MGSRLRVLPLLLALLGSAGRSGAAAAAAAAGLCEHRLDVSAAPNGTLRLPPGPTPPTATCFWLLEALPGEEVRVEVQQLLDGAQRPPAVKVAFEGGDGEGSGFLEPAGPGRFVLKGSGPTRIVTGAHLQPGLTVSYAVAVDWCARLNPCANGGTCSVMGSTVTCLCPDEWLGERCQTGLASSPLPGQSTIVTPKDLPPGTAEPSRSLSPSSGPAAAVEQSTARQRTRVRAHEAGTPEDAKPLSALGTIMPHSPLPPIATEFATSVPVSTLVPTYGPPPNAPGTQSISEEFSSSAMRNRLSEGWQASGAGKEAAIPTRWTAKGSWRPEPGIEGTVPGTTVAHSETSSMVAAKDLEMTTAVPPWPNANDRHLPWESKARYPSTEVLDAFTTSTWEPPLMNVTKQNLAWSPNASETSRPRVDATTIAMQSPLELEGFTWQPDDSAVSKAPEESERTLSLNPEPRFAEGHVSPEPALTQSPVNPRPSAGLDHIAEVTEERLVPSSLSGSTAPLIPNQTTPIQRTKVSWETEMESSVDALTSFTGLPDFVAAGRTETGSHSSVGPTSSLSPVSSAPSPMRNGGSLSSEPDLLPFSLAWLPSGSTEGRDSNMGPATLETSTGSVPVLGTGPVHGQMPWESPPISTTEKWASPGPPALPNPSKLPRAMGSLGPGLVNRNDPAKSSPRPTQFPLEPTEKGSVFFNTAPSSPETSASLLARVRGPRDFGTDPPRATTLPSQLVIEDHPSASTAAGQGLQMSEAEGSVGAGTQMAETPVSRFLVGGDGSAGWTPSLAHSAVPEVAFHTINAAHSEDAGLHLKAADVSGSTAATAVPLNKNGGTTAAGQRPGAPPTRTWWGRGRRPRGPTKSPARHATPSRGPGSEGSSTTSSGPPRSHWLTWPPMPAPEPGSVARGDPSVASTWLLAAVPEAATPLFPAAPKDIWPRAQQIFIVENQPPLLKAAFLHIPCELVLAMDFSRSFQNPQSAEYQRLVVSINETITPLLDSLPGFQRLEVKTIRPGSVVVEFDALFLPDVLGLWEALNRSSLAERLPPGLWVANASVLQSATLEKHLDLCAVLFSCRAGYECVAKGDGSATCTSMCHRDYCKNKGICTHVANHLPVCQCPVGSDFWFLGMRCDYKVTQQGLLGVACGLLLSLVVVGAAIAVLVVRRVRTLLLEARADQTKSSYRRFCRLDDVSAHYWSEPWLESVNSLDNPAFSNSEELLHLQILDATCCEYQDDSYCKQLQDNPVRMDAAGRPSFHYNWEVSSNSVNDAMIDSGKASEVSVSSWPMEPLQWSPFPVLHELTQQPRGHMERRPHSYCEGMELVNLERSWTA